MISFLPASIRFTISAVLTFTFTIGLHQEINAQNLLTNGSFETPAVSGININNIIGAGSSWGGWNCTNGGFNILHMIGSGYNSGANHASDGNQYVDVASSDGFISQQFVLDHASPLSFSGDYSNREAGWGSFVNWTAKIDILDSTGAVVASSGTRNFVTTDNVETWFPMTGSSSLLPAGTYTYRAYAGNSGHFDNAMVTALAGQVLAVRLINFTTVEKNNQLITSWTVNFEEKVDGYELQGSNDGINFKGIRFVAAKQNGTYNIVNRRPSGKTGYYRLKMIEEDGTFAYSKVIALQGESNGAVAVYPNPAASQISISVSPELTGHAASMSLLNIQGQVVKQEKFGNLGATENVDISQVSPGMYFVRVAAGSTVAMKKVQVDRH